MSSANLLIIHASCATIALLSGFFAMILRKGSGMHRIAGTVFFVAMLGMTSCAAYVAFGRLHVMNALNSIHTLYLVLTGWLAARRIDAKTTMLDVPALLLALAVGSAMVFYGFVAVNDPTGMLQGYRAVLYFVFGTIALLHGASDIRMVARGGVSGSSRIARHLWRMSLALLFTTLSLYPGQPRFFPPSWRATNLLYVPHILLFGSMMLALVRVNRQKRAAVAKEVPAVVYRGSRSAAAAQPLW